MKVFFLFTAVAAASSWSGQASSTAPVEAPAASLPPPSFGAPPAAAEKPAPETPKAEAPKPEPPKAEAPRPEAPPAEAPKPAPAPEPKAAEPAPKPELGRFAGPEAEWAFAKASAEDGDPAVQEAAAADLALFVRRFPDADRAPDALFLLAGLRQRRGDWQGAMAAYLRLIHEDPEAGVTLRAKSAYLELVEKKASRRQRQALNDLVRVPDSGGRAERLSGLWQTVAATVPDVFYAAAVDEVGDFLARHPEGKDGDKMLEALARLHAANEKPAAAVTAWRQLQALYPDSPLVPRAQLAVGDLYADALRDPKRAIDAYQDLIARFPRAPEVQASYEGSARLFEEKLRQYDLAVEMEERIVKAFPKTPAALKAYKVMARLERERLAKPDEAIKTLQALSAAHGGQDGVDALLLAADVARRDLKDYARQAELLHQVSDDYASAKEAPQALYDAGGVFESDLKDAPKAIDDYRELAGKFPASKLAKKAAARADKLAGGK